MAWFDNGIRSIDGLENLPTSNGIIYVGAFPCAEGARTCTSITAIGAETPFWKTIVTTKGGTQIQFKVTPVLVEDAQLYHPTERENVWRFDIDTRLHKAGTSISGSGWGGSLPGGLVGSSDNWGEYWERSTAENLPLKYNPSRAFPLGKTGNTHVLVCTADADGLKFWDLGYSGTTPEDVSYISPLYGLVAFIPASLLNNPAWFNPDEDGLSPEERDTSQGSNIINDDRDVQYDYPGEDVDFPSLPANGVLGMGYYKIYNPNSSQLTNAFDILWTDGIGEWWEVLSKIFYHPQDFIVSLMMTACPVTSSENSEIYFGKYPTNVYAPVVNSQWQVVDCGSIDVPLKYGSVLDYSPYQQAQIFLPFIGFRTLNVDQISGGKIAIKYYVDIFTGSAVCFMKISNIGSNNSVLYTFDCNVSMQVPITANNYSQLFTSLFSMGALAVPAIGASGMAAVASKEIPSAMNTAGASHRVEQSGHLASNIGMLGNEKPYLILQQVNQSKPQGYENYNGYPSNITSSLSNLSGFTKIESIHLNITATDEEISEIESLLKTGVIL